MKDWYRRPFLGRQKGDETPHDKGQKWPVILTGLISVPFLILVPPWEFASFSGPIPRAGILAWIGLLLFAIGIILQSIAMWQLRSYYTVLLGMLAFLIPIFLFIRARIRREEKMLLAEFGEEYAEYMRRTHKLIPFVY